MRVLFLGDRTAGVRSLDALARENAIVGVVAHPTSSNNDAGDESVFEHASGAGFSTVRLKGRELELARFVRDARPDVLWIADYGYLLPPEVLALAPLGAVNLHPSLLPHYRGRESIHWAIRNGERRIGLTAHFVNSGVDSGDIIAQQAIALSEDDDIGSALEKLHPIYARLSRDVAALLRTGSARAVPQAAGNWPHCPSLGPADREIDWSWSSQAVADFVRAWARPYPGASTSLGGTPMTIWRARAGMPSGPGSVGSIWSVERERFFVNCGIGSLEVLGYGTQGQLAPRVGDRFQTLDRAA